MRNAVFVCCYAVVAFTILPTIWAAVYVDSCFTDAEEMAVCCSRGELCFQPGGGYEHLGRAECCGETLVLALLRSARDLVATATAHNLAEAVGLLMALLLGVNSQSIEAWELLTHALSRQALNQFDDLVAGGFEQALQDPVGNTTGEEPAALSAARSLSRAAHLCENFFQVLWYSHAQATGQAAVDVDFKELKPAFAPTLQVYRLLHTALDTLTYMPTGRNAMVLKATSPPERGGPTVVLVMTVVGAWADVGVVTLWSLLRHRSVPLRIFVFGDAVGLRDWRRVVRELREVVPASLERVRFDYVDIFLHPRMQNYLRRLPQGCASTNMSIALFARLVCHEILPRDVDRAIAMDLGDILVFQDILDLWREGDRLLPGELLAAGSHRAWEESWRQGKPSRLNGGLVLYEVGRMRTSNYTEDTIRAARHGLEREYTHFCAWDQDIINVMHADIWGGVGVRVLPCRWSLFPVTGWQFFWNTPNFWPRELFERRRYPGVLAADHVEHYCPSELDTLYSVFAFDDDQHKAFVRDVAIAQGRRTYVRAPDGTTCGCGERAALLHVPSTMKLWPGAQRLFSHHAPPLQRRAELGAFISTRKEQEEDFGGGFWGAEDDEDIEVMGTHSIKWARDIGGLLAIGSCVTLPSVPAAYSHVDFKPSVQWKDGLRLAVETSAQESVHVFIGHISTPGVDSTSTGELENIGLEIVLGVFEDKRSFIRWGTQGQELTSYVGPILDPAVGTGESRTWSRFWVSVNASGHAAVGAGKIVGADGTVAMRSQIDFPNGISVGLLDVYVGSWTEQQHQWVLCQQ